jgi:guanyl-specific ribonuclease Sa
MKASEYFKERTSEILKKYSCRKVNQRKSLGELSLDQEIDEEVKKISEGKHFLYGKDGEDTLRIYDSDWHLEMTLDSKGNRVDVPLFSRKFWNSLRTDYRYTMQR